MSFLRLFSLDFKKKRKKRSYQRQSPGPEAVVGLPDVDVEEPLHEPDVGDGRGDEAVEGNWRRGRKRRRRKSGSGGGSAIVALFVVGVAVSTSDPPPPLFPPSRLPRRVQGKLVQHALEVEGDLSAAPGGGEGREDLGASRSRHRRCWCWWRCCCPSGRFAAAAAVAVAAVALDVDLDLLLALFSANTTTVVVVVVIVVERDEKDAAGLPSQSDPSEAPLAFPPL